MGKISKEYLEVLPFSIKEVGFHKDRDMVSESLFSLGNEYTGIRGFFDEGYSGKSLQGVYFNGIYEYGDPIPNAYKGISKRTHFTINSVNWVNCSFTYNNQKLDLNTAEIDSFERELDFKTGLYTHRFTWIVEDNKITFKFYRLVNMVCCHQAIQKIEISSEKPCQIKAIFSLDNNVLHWGNKCYWTQLATINKNKCYGLYAETISTNQSLTSVMKIDGLEAVKIEEDIGKISAKSTLNVTNEGICITRYVVNIVEKKHSKKPSRLIEIATDELKELFKKGFDKSLKENEEFYKKAFENSDIEIDGDEKNQQGIRFCLFQLQQTYHGYEKDNNIGAKGLTGEAYSGHAFWDSETYCLPYYLLSNQQAAKNLLLFRYNTLEQAKLRAKELDCEGACYPVATRNGEEACTLWQHASLQFQPSTGVSYAIHHYMNVYHDERFMKNYGLEMLIEISKFLYSRGEYNSDGTEYGYFAVMGPDEFQMMVNQNTYTNYMAKKTFDYLLEVIERAEFDVKPIMVKTHIDAEFLKKIKEASEKMIILYDEETKLFEQHDGFYKLPHVDVDKIPQEDFPLYSHWSYDRIYRNDMIKQPDVLMFMLLHNSDFTNEQLKANYEFYEPKCIHESSLSPSVHSILACQLNKQEEAYKFFEFATRLDLDDYNNNTCEGIHTTSIAAAWMNIVYGFAGFRSDLDELCLNPILPNKWNSYSFKLKILNALLKITVDKNQITILNSGDPITLKIYGKNHLISKSLILKNENA